MADKFNEYMQIIAGANPQKSNAKQLSDADKKKLSSNYFELFYNLTATNWLRGGNLGRAWYVALNQMKQYITAQAPNNPAAMYLRQVFAAHNTRWAQIMMTSPHRNDTIDAPADKRAEWTARVAQKTTAALNDLNSVLAQYRVETKTQQANTATKQAAMRTAMQNIQMQILMQMKRQQNGGMAA